MTIDQLFDLGRDYPWLMLGWFVLLPAFTWALTYCHQPASAGRAPWRYVYAVLAYLTCVPGMLAALVVAYLAFFRHGDLMKVDILTYFLPVASMVATLLLIHRTVAFARLPGVKRLWGFIVMMGVAMVLALIVAKTRIWLVFGGTIVSFLVVLCVAFVLLYWVAHVAFGSEAGEQAEREPDPVMPPPPEPPLGGA